MKLRKLCKCCRKKLTIAFGATKYCNSCSLHVNDLVKLIHYWKNKAKLTIKLQQEAKRLRLALKIVEEKNHENR